MYTEIMPLAARGSRESRDHKKCSLAREKLGEPTSNFETIVIKQITSKIISA